MQKQKHRGAVCYATCMDGSIGDKKIWETPRPGAQNI